MQIKEQKRKQSPSSSDIQSSSGSSSKSTLGKMFTYTKGYFLFVFIVNFVFCFVFYTRQSPLFSTSKYQTEIPNKPFQRSNRPFVSNRIYNRIYKSTSSINNNYSPIKKTCDELLHSSDVVCNFQTIQKKYLQKHLKSI